MGRVEFASMSFFRRMLGRTQVAEPVEGTGTAAELACSFCGATQRQVRKLIAGPSAYICDGCIRISYDLAVKDGPAEDRAVSLRDVVLAEMSWLRRDTPRAVTRRMVLAAIELTGSDAAALRRVAQAAWLSGDPEGGLLALERIPLDERNADDVITMSVHLENAGAYERAIEVLDSLDLAQLDPTQRAVVPLHRAVTRLAGGLAAPEEARALEGIADGFVGALPALAIDDAYAAALLREALLVRARAAVLAAELTRAEALLRARVLDAEDDAECWSLLYEIHRTRGEHAQAHEARERALAHARPEGTIADRLRDSSGSPFR